MAPRKEVTLSLLTFLILVVVALGLAYSYRFQGLELRPMHTDEAILGMKLAETWKTGHFTYDPKDFHGPALHQVSLFWSNLAGWGDPSLWTEADLRMVAAMCSMALLLVTLLFADALGRYGTAIAMLMMAASPMMVFYSRYFIMEMLLVLLIAVTLGSFWRYSQGGTRLWLVLGGCSLGFQHATKETFILNVGAAIVGWLAARSLIGEFEPRKPSSFSIGSSRKKGRPARPWLWVAIPAIFISVASFSNGFRDWQAVGDSFLTYLHYLERSGGSGHEKPWHYYITLIFWRKDTLIWTEAMIGGLALIGMIYAFVGDFKNTGRQAFLVFLSVYSLVLLAGYSVLSYKTPWSILSAQHAFILLGGLGAGALWSAMPGTLMRWIYNILLGLGILHLCNQSLGLTGTHPNPQLEYSADPRNPYAYSHTQKSLLKLLDVVKAYVGDKADSKTIQVISRDSGWPLPWYWRNWKNVGYQDQVPAKLEADVIVVDGEFYDAVKSRIDAAQYTEHYPYGLRPGIILSVLLRKAPATPAPAPQPQTSASPAPVPAEAAPATAPAPAPEPAMPPAPPEGTLSQPPSFSPSLPSLPGGLVPQPQL